MAKNEKKAVEAAQDQHGMINAKSNEETKSGFKKNAHEDAQWFKNAGLGLFIHWGISGVHDDIDISWSMIANTPWDKELENKNKLTPNEYFELADDFNPSEYDVDKWLRTAKKSGFKYVVFTTKHHDGYAMWPSEAGEFGVKTYLNSRDLVKPYVEACRKNGLKVGFYYSPPDWYFNKEYMSFSYGSENDDAIGHLGQDHEPIEKLKEKPKDFQGKYLKYIKTQVEELLTQYGKIDVLFFDGGPQAISFKRIRQLQPGIVVNPRMHGYGDYETPECFLPTERPSGWWELCDVWDINNIWGYTKREEYKSTGWMLSRLCRTRAMGGNYLINVGPKPNGELPKVYYDRLSELETWMNHSSEAIFDVCALEDANRCNVPVTVKERVWYLHVLPNFEGDVIFGTEESIASIELLETKEKIAHRQSGKNISLKIPRDLRSQLVDIVKVTFAAKPKQEEQEDES